MTRGKQCSHLNPCCVLPHVYSATLIVKLNLLPCSVWYGLVAAGVQFWKSRSGEIDLEFSSSWLAWVVHSLMGGLFWR